MIMEEMFYKTRQHPHHATLSPRFETPPRFDAATEFQMAGSKMGVWGVGRRKNAHQNAQISIFTNRLTKMVKLWYIIRNGCNQPISERGIETNGARAKSRLIIFL